MPRISQKNFFLDPHSNRASRTRLQVLVSMENYSCLEAGGSPKGTQRGSDFGGICHVCAKKTGVQPTPWSKPYTKEKLLKPKDAVAVSPFER